MSIEQLEKRVAVLEEGFIAQMKLEVQTQMFLNDLTEKVLMLNSDCNELLDLVARLHPEITTAEFFSNIHNRRQEMEIAFEKIKAWRAALSKLAVDPPFGPGA